MINVQNQHVAIIENFPEDLLDALADFLMNKEPEIEMSANFEEGSVVVSFYEEADFGQRVNTDPSGALQRLKDLVHLALEHVTNLAFYKDWTGVVWVAYHTGYVYSVEQVDNNHS